MTPRTSNHDTALQDGDGGDGFLVDMDLGVGDAGVVVDHRVGERGPHLCIAVGAARLAGRLPGADVDVGEPVQPA